MKFQIYLIASALLVIASCNTASNTQEPEAINPSESQTQKFSVNESGYSLEVSLEKTECSAETRLEFDKNFGHVEFFINENFDFILSQEETSLQEIKEELEQDALFTRKFYNHTDNELFYQNVLPDGTEMGYNLIRKTRVKEKDYIFKSNPQQEFSKEDIENAQLILNKIS